MEKKKGNRKRALAGENEIVFSTLAKVPVPIAVIDPHDQIILFVNPSFLSFTGYSTEFVVGHTVAGVFALIDFKQHEKTLDSLRQTGEEQRLGNQKIITGQNQNEDIRNVDLIYQRLPFLNGDNEAVMITVEDVTKTASVRKKLDDATTEFNSILEQSVMAIGIYRGEDMRLSFANEPMKAILGRGEEAYGIPFRQAFPEVDDASFDALLMRVYKSGLPYYGYEVPILIVREGKETNGFYSFVNQPLRNASNEIIGVVSIGTEVTQSVHTRERAEKSEQKLQELFKQAPAAIAILNGPEHVYSLANSLYQKLFNRNESDLLGRALQDVFPDGGANNISGIVRSVYQSGEAFVDTEFHVEVGGGNDARSGYYNFVAQPIKSIDGNVTDILVHAFEVSGQVEARKKIEVSESRFRHLIDASPIGVIFWDIDGGIFNANEAFLQMLGYSREDVSAGLNWRNLTPEKWAPLDETRKELLIATGSHVPFEKQYFHKTGKPIDVIIASSTFEGTNNRQGVTFVLDITSRKQAEQAQLYRKAMLEAQNEAVPDAILIVDTKGGIISHNKHFVELWNIPPEIIEAKDDSAALKYVLEQLVDPKGFIDRVNYCYMHPNEKAHEYISFKDGRIVERYGNSVVGDDGTVYGWIWFFRDITQQRKAEERIRESEQRFVAAVEAVEGVLWTNNAQGEMEGEQIGWARLTGQTQEEYRGYGWTNAVHPDDVTPTVIAWNEAVKETRMFSFEHRLRLRNGEWGVFSIRAIPMLRPDGTVREWVGVHTNITAQRSSEAALRESENRYQNFIRQSSEGIWRFELERPIPTDLPVEEQVELMFRDGFLAECNDAMAKMYGYDSADELLGARLTDFLPPNDDSRAYLSFLITSEYRAQNIESKEVDRYGDIRYFSNTLVGVIESNMLVRAWGTQKDITFQKQAEEELRDSESRFQNLIREASVGIILLTGKEMKVDIVNDAFARLIDRTTDELLNKELFTVIPETEEYYRPILERVLETGEPVNLYDSPYSVTSNGKETSGFLNVVYQPYVNISGGLNGVMVLCQDVTQSVKARKALEESESKFRSVIAEAPAGISLFVGRDLVIENPNQAFIDIVGKGWGIVGLPLREAMPELITEDQPYLEILDKVFITGEAYRTSGSLVKIVKNGVLTSRYYNFTYSPLFINGKVWAILDIAIDVTDQIESAQKLEESENRFRTMAQALPQMVWMMDSAGNIEYGSNEWEEYSGYADVMQAWEYMMHPDDTVKLMSDWQRLFESKTSYRKEVRLKNKAGEYRWFMSVGEPVLDGKGTLLKWIGTLTDIHEQKTFSEKLEREVALRTEQLAQANKELYRSNEDLQQFAHVASHDLKEPVRKIMTFANRLKYEYSENLPDKAQTYLTKIDSATRRMYDMIDGVLLYSSVMSSELASELVDLNQVLKSIEADLEVPIASRNATIEYEHLPVVSGSRLLLYQLFYNLIGNSLKFAREEVQPEIKIVAGEATAEMLLHAGVSANHEYLSIRVSDNGIGLDPDHVTKIFGTFTRLHSKDRYEGTGLGLSLCKKIAERHGGAIWAEGREGEGAIFYVLLPKSKSLQ